MNKLEPNLQGVRCLREDFAIDVFDDLKMREYLPHLAYKKLSELLASGEHQIIDVSLANEVANSMKNWAVSRGATHFSHWFQPMTGETAEKQECFIGHFDPLGRPLLEFSGEILVRGEPDASSFPHGGLRCTHQARGYTLWDPQSPAFLRHYKYGSVLCVPTAFGSWTGEALDYKVPLLKSEDAVTKEAMRTLRLLGDSEAQRVYTTLGCEQEFFVIARDKYLRRLDLVSCGRTVIGAKPVKGQELEDQYFKVMPKKVMELVQDFECALWRLGVPTKTRHNEVAPSQFELAPIFSEANLAADNNQVIMTTLRRIAEKHDMMVLLHEKPFAGINGSGKHVNWSMSDNTGLNLLEPGKEPQENMRFLATVAMIVEALNRHAKILRTSISGAGNDHRLGANEAPPSIISAYLGDTLDKIFRAIMEDKTFSPSKNNVLDLGSNQLAHLLLDNTDRNRTSPFAFTGNKFEFRAVGASHAIGFPMTILNAAVAEVMNESNIILETDLASGLTLDQALMNLIKKHMGNSLKVVFNGDGYSKEWVEEAQKRGLPNLRTTPEALFVLADKKNSAFLENLKIFTSEEVETRYNVLLERYIKIREIEFETMIDMIHQFVIPAALDYKNMLANILKQQKEIGVSSHFEMDNYKKVSTKVDEIHEKSQMLLKELESEHHDHQKYAEKIAKEMLPLSVTMASICNTLEELIPNHFYRLPKYYDMLFLR
jgi:glutamine synthetase